MLILLPLLILYSCLLLSKATLGSLHNESIGKIAQFFAAPHVSLDVEPAGYHWSLVLEG
jgi:hypothetical protein